MITPYDSVVVRTVCKLVIPFAQVFGLYVIFHGHESPGGGFQGGAIIGASIILTRFTVPRSIEEKALGGSWAIRAGAAGVLVFAAVGLAPILFGGSFLDYGAVPLPGVSTAGVRSLGILAVEAGVALAVTGVMVSIFDDLAPNPWRPAGGDGEAAGPEAET
jgi:multicomponent Na+:H+ antiporter subunit B